MLLKVHRDVTEALDNRCMVALVLFDLSAVFDVIDHRIPERRLKYSCDVTGSASSRIECAYGSDIIRVIITIHKYNANGKRHERFKQIGSLLAGYSCLNKCKYADAEARKGIAKYLQAELLSKGKW